MKILSRIVILALGSVAHAACKTDGSASSIKDDAPTASDSGESAQAQHLSAPVQLNDLSILFPLGSSQADIDHAYLTPSQSGAMGALLPEQAYQAATDGLVSSGSHSFTIPKREEMRLVSLRLDPCFAHAGQITDLTQCQPQMRLIFEHLTMQPDPNAPLIGAGSAPPPKVVQADDMAVHALYDLTLDQFFALGNQVIALRQAATQGDMGRLAVHPIMAKQGVTGSFAKAINQLVLKYAGAKDLVHVAAFERSAIGQFSSNWVMQAADLTNGLAALVDVPSLPAGTQTQTITQPLHEFNTTGLQMKELLFDVQTTLPDNLALLLTTDSGAATSADRQAAFDAAIHIENPHLQTARTIDCASCHTAAIAKRLGIEAFNLQPDPAAQPFTTGDAALLNLVIAPTGLLNASPQSSTNIHAFSYGDAGPMIMQRVVNETADIVAFLNGLVH